MLRSLRQDLAELLFAAAVLGGGALSAVQAQPVWKPEKQVTIVVPYSPGGGTDAQSRAVARDCSASGASR